MELHKVRVLAIEDDEFVGALLASVAFELEYDVHHAATHLAIEHALTTPWDLILLDISVPGYTERSLFERLRRSQPDAAILIISGDEGDDLTRALEGAEAAGLRVLGVHSKIGSFDALRAAMQTFRLGATL
jgi:CheY-like chemotaxis protein